MILLEVSQTRENSEQQPHVFLLKSNLIDKGLKSKSFSLVIQGFLSSDHYNIKHLNEVQ